MKRVTIINPLISERATGMGVAGEGLRLALPEEAISPAPRLDTWFRRINRVRPAALRQVLRFLFAQLVPWLAGRGTVLLFSSHHAPVWRTNRHVVIINDLIALRFPDQSPAQTWYYRRVLPRVVRAATRVVTLSHAVQAELAAEYPGTAAARATVIPAYSIRLGEAPGAGQTLAARRERGMLVFVGARYRHKNLGLLLTALQRVECRTLSVTVTSCRRELWPEIGALEAAGRVRIKDYFPPAELGELYGSALALVYPSLAEGQGLPPLEALAAGCPVICADIPVLRETCGDAAFHIDPTDAAALAGLLGRLQSGELDSECVRHAALARQRVEAFGQPALRAKWRELLEGMS
jgi:glycosyltransferase involved in cell wall biosynthesis